MSLSAYIVIKGGDLMLISRYSYVTEDPSGTRRYFYYASGKGINCVIKTDSAEESSPDNLVENGTDDFSVDIEGDYIYLLYKDTNNKLNLMIWNGDKWTASPLMKNSITGSIHKPNILLDHGRIHIFYENLNDKGYFLVHHFWNKKKWLTNIIVKSENTLLYQFNKSPSGLHGIYNDNGKLKCLNFSYIYDTWSKPSFISNVDANNFFINVDSKYNNIHIIYSADDRLHYTRKTSGNQPGESIQDNILFSGKIELPSIFYIKGKLWATWFCNGFIYTSLSADNGETWSNPFKISSEIDKLSTYCFISLKQPYLNRIHAFCYTENPYYLILIDDIFNPRSSGFSYFTFYINQIQQYIDQMSDKLEKQKNKNSDLIKNMRKLEVSYKDMNVQYSMLKKSYGNILAEINKLKSENQNLKNENITLKETLDENKGGLFKKIFSRIHL